MKSNICIYVLYTKIAGIWYFEIQQLVETGVLIQFGIWIYHLKMHTYFFKIEIYLHWVCIEKKFVKTSQNLKKIDFLFNRIILGLFYVKGIFFFQFWKNLLYHAREVKGPIFAQKRSLFLTMCQIQMWKGPLRKKNSKSEYWNSWSSTFFSLSVFTPKEKRRKKCKTLNKVQKIEREFVVVTFNSKRNE